MKPVKRDNPDFKYEQVPTNKFVSGIIEEIQRNENYVKVFKGKERVIDAVRFKFKLDGMEFSRYSRWETFNYSSKSNLFKNYLLPLVKGAQPNMDFDLENLVGRRIQTFWVQNGEYQNLQMIIPAEEPTVVAPSVEVAEEEAPI